MGDPPPPPPPRDRHRGRHAAVVVLVVLRSLVLVIRRSLSGGRWEAGGGVSCRPTGDSRRPRAVVFSPHGGRWCFPAATGGGRCHCPLDGYGACRRPCRSGGARSAPPLHPSPSNPTAASRVSLLPSLPPPPRTAAAAGMGGDGPRGAARPYPAVVVSGLGGGGLPPPRPSLAPLLSCADGCAVSPSAWRGRAGLPRDQPPPPSPRMRRAATRTCFGTALAPRFPPPPLPPLATGAAVSVVGGAARLPIKSPAGRRTLVPRRLPSRRALRPCGRGGGADPGVTATAGHSGCSGDDGWGDRVGRGAAVGAAW